ncbi:MAG: TorF family putative porin [Bdellovibrio bacteriovorus]
MKATRILQSSTAASLGTLMLLLAGPASAEDPWSISANIGAVSNYMWRGVTQTQDGPAIQGGLDVKHQSGFYAGTWISNVDFNDEGGSQISTVKLDEFGQPIYDDKGFPVYETTGLSDPSSPNYEMDFYLGFGGNITEDLSYDLKGILYTYPDGEDFNFGEIGGSMTFKWFTLGLAYTVYGQAEDAPFDEGDFYYYAGFEYSDLPFGLSFSARGGYYDFDSDQLPAGFFVSNGQVIEVTDSADYWNYGASISKDAGDFGTFSLNWDQNDGNTKVGYDDDPKFWVGWLKEF